MSYDRFERLGRYDLSSLNVLIVEDHANMQKLLRTILHSFGVVNIQTAGSGEEGYEKLQEFAADLVITDWNMEPMNGLDFANLVRNGDKTPNPYVPIIMLTGQTELQRVIQARNAGINLVLTKPISASTLAERITTLIDNPVPFVRTGEYFGPDRRRRDEAPPSGRERRKDRRSET